MKDTKEELYNLGLNFIKESVQFSALSTDMRFCEKVTGQITYKFNMKRGLLQHNSNDIDYSIIKKFFRLPKISNIFVAYLQYVIYTNVFKDLLKTEQKKERVSFSDVYIYVTKTFCAFLSDNSGKENDVIKKFMENLTMSCVNISFLEVAKEDIIAINDNELSLDKSSHLYSSKKIEKEINKTIEKIKYELSKEPILYNSVYNSVKDGYLRNLKQFYQMQFVYMLGDFRFGEFYIPPIVLPLKQYELLFRFSVFDSMEKTQYEIFKEKWKHIFKINNIIYIVGGPGFGKSLFLKFLINNSGKLEMYNSNEYLTIYCDLKTFYSKGKKNKKSIIDFLQESMIAVTGIDEEKLSKDFIQSYLEQGRCIVLFDALDEVPKDVRDELHKKIVVFFSNSNPNNKICITSRDRGFFPQGDIEVYEICPLTTMDIEQYLDKMISLRKFKKEDKKHFMEQAQILIEKNFLNNFLALSLLVSIYRSENKLPENKTNLYKKCFEYIAKEREIEEKDETGFDWGNVAPLMKDSTFITLSTLGVPNNNDISRKDVEKILLEQYKFRFGDEIKAECAIKEFLEFCSSRTELFVPSAREDKFKFFHRSFFEYFYSRYIHQCSTVEDMYNYMEVFDVDSEVFELTVAMVKEDNELKYQKLVNYLFEKAEESFCVEMKKNSAFSILTLAMQVIDDEYFKQRYFNLVVNEYERILFYDYKEFNNKLVAKWLISAINDKKDNLEMFRERYEESCIAYVLGVFSGFSKEQITEYKLQDKMKSKEKVSFSEITFFSEYSFVGNMTTMPFFFNVYTNYFNVYKKLEDYNDLSPKKISESFKHLSSVQRKEVKKGINVYRSFREDMKVKMCEMIKG